MKSSYTSFVLFKYLFLFLFQLNKFLGVWWILVMMMSKAKKLKLIIRTKSRKNVRIMCTPT